MQEARLARRMRFFLFCPTLCDSAPAFFFSGHESRRTFRIFRTLKVFFFVLRVTDLQACACCVILICVFRVLWSQVCVCVCVWKCSASIEMLGEKFDICLPARP